MKTKILMVVVAALFVGANEANAVEQYIGGTAVAANHAEGCCRAVSGNTLFNFNGGVGSLLGIGESDRQTLDGLDERSGGDGIWNPGGTGGVEGNGALLSGPGQAVFTIAPPPGGDFITGFQVMNATNAQFDERQSDRVVFEVSTDGGASFQTVLDTPLDVVVTDGTRGTTDFAPAPAQQFSLSDAIAAATVDFIRITASENITSHNNVAPSLAELRVVVDNVVPEPATAGLLVMGAVGLVARRRRRTA